MAGNVALVAGGTGLVGRELLRLLSADPATAEIRALVRRPLVVRQDSKVRECRGELDRLDAHPEWFDGIHAAFCALGTTIKKAGSQEAFRRVDFDFPLAIARAARASGARHFLLVSALGASARSTVFYNRVKGELEDQILALGYPSVTIARPSVLLGEREERRPGEELAKKIGWLFPGKWRPVEASRVAAALVHAARVGKPGVEILENAALRAAG
ncbi:MAG TPA: NAD(P)H-binding protein [Burkholderiales bacterium]|nr:NAD(P)H-binding protein [Burkholderiales bacterium]